MKKMSEILSDNKSSKSRNIKWNFGEKHKEYIRKCRHNSFNVAEGAVRAGKTIDNILAFALEIEHTPDKIHLATGSTLANAKLNIAEANGFGLKYIFRGRSRMGKFDGYECIYINTLSGVKVVIFAGAKKANSFEKIRGNSYGLWIATEVNLHHANMIRECLDRSLMAKNRKMFWDLNPDNPRHEIYSEYIDAYEKVHKDGKFEGGYNYENFTIYDNNSLTESRKRAIISQYDKESIYYKRNILGIRAAAEGLIYREFADKPEKYFIKQEDVPNFRKINIGVDFGGGPSKTTFVATGIYGRYEKLYILASKTMKAGKMATVPSAPEIAKAYVDFLTEVEGKYGLVKSTYYDSAEQVIPQSMKLELKNRGLVRTVTNCYKGQINDRIKITNSLIHQGRLYYTEDATTVRDALSEAIWDDKASLIKMKDVRLDNHTTDIDSLDAFEYSFSDDMRRFSRNVG